MATQAEIEEYNYSVFTGSEDFRSFRPALPAGSVALDFTATLLDAGQPVQLSDYWRDRDVVIEFGSLT
jgi:hypothetical protein